MTTPATEHLVHPVTRLPLWADTPHSLTDGQHRHPVVAGIPYLRSRRKDVAAKALNALDVGDDTMALMLLLQDQDDWAPEPAPDFAAIAQVLTGKPSYRDAMRLLNFGPVAHYFAHRWSAPSFLSALGLLAAYAPLDRPLIDVACGTGQILREVALRGGIAIGVDQVFAKLWLGQRYLGLQRLICADAQSLPMAASDTPRTVICHDALYFLDDTAKQAAVRQMRAVAGPQGAVLLGHCHIKDHPHAGDRAHPMTRADWQALLPEAACHDDAALTQWFLSSGAQPLTLHTGADPAAVALALGHRQIPFVPYWDPVGALCENPLLAQHGAGMRPVWPTAGFAREYAQADYLVVPDAAADRTLSDASRFARRILVPLPPEW